jgi:hypothetical protein
MRGPMARRSQRGRVFPSGHARRCAATAGGSRHRGSPSRAMAPRAHRGLAACEPVVELTELLRHRSLGIRGALLAPRAFHERAPDRRGDHRQETDPQEHDDHGNELSGEIRGDVVAISDGRDRLGGPPEPGPDGRIVHSNGGRRAIRELQREPLSPVSDSTSSVKPASWSAAMRHKHDAAHVAPAPSTAVGAAISSSVARLSAASKRSCWRCGGRTAILGMDGNVRSRAHGWTPLVTGVAP